MDGLTCLANQARRTLSLWTGVDIKAENFLKALEKECQTYSLASRSKEQNAENFLKALEKECQTYSLASRNIIRAPDRQDNTRHNNRRRSDNENCRQFQNKGFLNK